ncbi:NAD-dependent epimerase/dehydratase family protein [Cyanobium sp. Morenito 9A2]|uniref:NAD-dependent epimerase/dehydratase family protein n=1 Tax=Cyanobium sp. Morenito 9A2 TaxID=2823718 RepID=UPI0020CE5694|nr:NAD-dependent epimerase/dehydratase family protein [Cyanobium sp. Morenito 9A2]MCP9850231.1 GDP-mannose 4,6-dehydratase [Cyanobium sp. Morenito 9A2]
MKTIIIGGAGFIGRSLCDVLIQMGREVTVVGRRSADSLSDPPGCTYISADIGNRSQLRSLLEPGCELIDLAYATVPKTSYGDPIFDLLSNLPASVGLLQEAMTVGIRRLLLVSSGGTVYGPCKSLPMTESHPTAPVSPYGITKLTIDHYAMMFHHTMDLPVVIVRPGNAYGPRQKAGTGQGFIAAAIDSLLEGRAIDLYGEKGTLRDYIHVHDVAVGMAAALDSGHTGAIYNVGTGVGSSNLDIIDAIRPHALNSGISVEIRELAFRRFDVAANILDSRKLQQDTGWQPQVSLDNGIAEMWRSACHNRRAGGQHS